MIVLPDVQIVCTSSTECDLRFYDVAAKKFDLRILVSGDTDDRFFIIRNIENVNPR